MTDARFDAARATDQSRGRGWAFDPPSDREPSRMGLALAILGAVIAVAALIGALA